MKSFIGQVVAVCPHLFPMSFAHCLVAIAADKSQEQDRLGRACLATMCELGWYVSLCCGNSRHHILTLLIAAEHNDAAHFS